MSLLWPAGKIVSTFLEGQEVKLNVAALGAGGSLGLFSLFRVVSARAKERKGQTPERVFAFCHSDEEVASSYSPPSEHSPISRTEPPDSS